ncbi:carbohydrate porin [Anatilimnocola sp. NA78]|uniref:carbohydrate porin n=1 Tax=Anatilimnocola sp. NA78 TaxID=3415683 RepID=UPI003CE5093F
MRKILASLLLGIGYLLPVHGLLAPVQAEVLECAECEEAPPPTPPLPNFCGPLCERSKLTGDWHGVRTCLLESGMMWDIDHVNFLFGNVSGGRQQGFTFAGHGDYVMNWDLSKVIDHQGLFFKLRAEHRYGESIGGYDGTFLPSTIPTDLPVSNSENIYLTNVLFTQMLSETFGVFAGKMDTLDGDMNAYAHKRGKDQFSNLAFVANPLLLRAVPYCTLATGFVILEDMQPLFTFTVLNAKDTTRNSGFGELFEEGCVLSAQYRKPYEIEGFAGHVVVGGAWNSRKYVSLGQDPRILLPDVPIAQTSGTWAVFGNFDQQLVSYSGAPGAGWGLFGRASVADNEANPLAQFFSLGIGGNSPICGRHQDTFGVGYYYLGTSNQIGVFLQAALGPIGDGQGVEMFYNYEVTPWFHLTADMQVLQPEVVNLDPALLVGLRAKIDF